MDYITIDIFTDKNKAEKMKERREAMGYRCTFKEVKGITVNECLNSCVPKYDKDGAPLYIIISEG